MLVEDFDNHYVYSLAPAPSFKFQKGDWEAHLALNSLYANCFIIEMQEPQITRDVIQAQYKKNREMKNSNTN